MRYEEFEQSVLDLWMTSQVPLSLANLLFYTGSSHKQIRRYLEEMSKHGLLDVDSDDEGELVYLVRGSSRPASGTNTLVRCQACGKGSIAGSRCNRCGQNLDARFRSIAQGFGQTTTALTLVQKGAHELMRPVHRTGDKSIVMGGMLGLLGPFGWFYAGAWRETIPAAVVWTLLFSLPLIKPLFWLLLPILLPLSALVGVVYTSGYNRNQRRKALLLGEEKRS